MTPSEAFVETLAANGVTDMFGIMGPAFMDAMDIFAPAGIRLIPVVHEQGAGHMADGYARVSGRHGVVIGQNGPGISNCVTAIAAAYWAHSPVVIVTPEAGTMGIGLGGFQEANQLPMFQEFTKYQGHVTHPARMAEFTARCFDRAQAEMADPAEHPARLLLRQGQGRDSATAPARSRRRRRTKPGRRSGTDRAGEIPGDHLGRRRRDGRRNRGMQGARRTARRAGRQQLPAQRLVPGEPSAVVRPARLPARRRR